MKRFGLCAFPMLLLTACTSIAEPAADVRVLTSSYTRQASGGFGVVFNVTNTGRDTVYVRRCGWISAEVLRRRNSEWIEVHSAHCTANLDGSPIALPPGVTLSGEQFIAEAGHYRLRIGVSRQRSGQYETAVSSTFVLE